MGIFFSLRVQRLLHNDCVFISLVSMQQRVKQGLEDGARLPCLDIEKLRGENSSLREEQQRLKKVCLCVFDHRDIYYILRNSSVLELILWK